MISPLEDIQIEVLLPDKTIVTGTFESRTGIEIHLEPQPVVVGVVPAIEEVTVEIPGPAYVIDNSGGGSGRELFQSTPASTWTFDITGFIRRPAVSVWIDSQEVETDYTSSTTQVVVSFPSPQAGSIILT